MNLMLMCTVDVLSVEFDMLPSRYVDKCDVLIVLLVISRAKQKFGANFGAIFENLPTPNSRSDCSIGWGGFLQQLFFFSVEGVNLKLPHPPPNLGGCIKH